MENLSGRFRFHLFRGRGVSLLLLYNLLTVPVFSAINILPTNIPPHVLNVVYGFGFCVFPIAGWLADYCCSRYKLIKISMWLIWVSVMIKSVVTIVLYVMGVCSENESNICKGVAVALQVLSIFGLSGFLSNNIQFGMDQLQDAPTIKITSFIVWYIWTWNFGNLLGVIFTISPCGTLKLITTLSIPACVSLALCLDNFFNHWFVKEPVGQNPFKVFFGVLHYAIKNKYPHQRSAFTYWEDKPYSRIDLAKSKYGGPFTTEQVEDVKIILRSLTMLSLGCVGAGLLSTLMVYYNPQVLYHLSSEYSTQPSQNCTEGIHLGQVEFFVVEYFHLFVIIFIIPIHEFAIYPVFKKHIIEMNSTAKLFYGLFFLVLQNNTLLIIESVGYYYTDVPYESVVCFMSGGKQFLSLSFKWYSFSGFFLGLAWLYMTSGAIEFICSQTPYSMKGLLLGSTYLFYGLSFSFSGLFLLPVSLTVEKWSPVPYGCGVWFYLCVTIFYLIFTLVCIAVDKKVYKMRRRDEDLHNRHIFAINYYSHYVQYNAELEANDGIE